MDVFCDYALHYDALNQGKNYQVEVDYIHRLVQRFCPSCKDILELGCGTGIHASLLASKGLSVYGVDQSKKMIDLAEQKKAPGVSYEVCDIRKLRLERHFDVIISLFHVLSYQVSERDLSSMLETVERHLRPGGIFIFDFWYAPAVLAQRPSERLRSSETDKLFIERFAKPTLKERENLVEVQYNFKIKDKESGEVSEFFENHPMRYFTIKELEDKMASYQLKTLLAEEWLTEDPPSENTWGVCMAVQKRIAAT